MTSYTESLKERREKTNTNEYQKGQTINRDTNTPDGSMVEKHTDRNKETKKPEARSKL